MIPLFQSQSAAYTPSSISLLLLLLLLLLWRSWFRLAWIPLSKSSPVRSVGFQGGMNRATTWKVLGQSRGEKGGLGGA